MAKSQTLLQTTRSMCFTAGDQTGRKNPKCQNKQELKLVALQTEDTKSLMMFCQLFQEHFVP